MSCSWLCHEYNCYTTLAGGGRGDEGAYELVNKYRVSSSLFPGVTGLGSLRRRTA
jgi:hypothetical protein